MKSDSKVRMDGSIENKSWADPKTVFNPYPTLKISHYGPKMKSKVKSRNNPRTSRG